MTTDESRLSHLSDTGANPDDTPEIRAQVSRLFERVTDTLHTAPDVADRSEINNPTSPRFQVISREVKHDGNSVKIVPGAPEAEVRDTVTLGSVALNEGHLLPMKGAQHRYNALVADMLVSDDPYSTVRTTLERRMEIGGQSARVVMYVIQHPHQGGLDILRVDFKTYRLLPDGNRFLQDSTVAYPGDFNPAIVDQDAIIDPDGWYLENRAAARATAAAVLPQDADFPSTQPLGLAQCEQLLQ